MSRLYTILFCVVQFLTFVHFYFIWRTYYAFQNPLFPRDVLWTYSEPSIQIVVIAILASAASFALMRKLKFRWSIALLAFAIFVQVFAPNSYFSFL